MKVSFAEKHVLITGGSEGIGLALAKQFLSDGAAVTLLARNIDKLKQAQSELKVRFPVPSDFRRFPWEQSYSMSAMLRTARARPLPSSLEKIGGLLNRNTWPLRRKVCFVMGASECRPFILTERYA